MKTSLHLVAMPLGYPMHPSAQLGCLHGYIESRFKEQADIKSYSAFLEILHTTEGASLTRFFRKYNLVGEEIFFLVCCYYARRAGLDVFPALHFPKIFKLYNDFRKSACNVSQQDIVTISKAKIAEFSSAMEKYVGERIVPSLREDGINVIGFTCTYCQLFGSIFAAKYLQLHGPKNVMFLFGGSSMALPEAHRTMRLWGLDGLIVSGSGEAPLGNIIQTCLALEPTNPADVLEALSGRKFRNVSRIGSTHSPVDLGLAKEFMESLPVPNYDEFFQTLRDCCADDETYRYAVSKFTTIPLEGSRGCFAKCDFCDTPNNTSQFRSLTGQAVARRAVEICDKYSRYEVTFVDSVCNTWAEDYARSLVSQDKQISSFMEMRVHAPESFWTRLSLSGVSALQLGIEAISEPLLRNLRKGTTVMQNLSATKYTAELGIENPSNLIIFHPKSTVEDVEETKRILLLVQHMPIYLLSHFVVSYGSPFYTELDDVKKTMLVRGFDWLPSELTEYSWPRHLSYTYQPEWMDSNVVAAWHDFQQWYADHAERIAAARPILMVECLSNGDLRLVDTRFGRHRELTLSGAEARIYNICHTPSKSATVAIGTGLPLSSVQQVLNDLVEDSLVLRVGERHLSLALRSREALLSNLLREDLKAVSTHHTSNVDCVPLTSLPMVSRTA